MNAKLLVPQLCTEISKIGKPPERKSENAIRSDYLKGLLGRY